MLDIEEAVPLENEKVESMAAELEYALAVMKVCELVAYLVGGRLLRWNMNRLIARLSTRLHRGLWHRLF